MRKYIQKQLIEMLPTIRAGVKHAKSNKAVAETVLSDCYAAVNVIGDALESQLSADRFSQYNEALDMLKAMLNFLIDAILEDKPTKEVSDDIKEQVKILKKELENESEVKLEIVFMPYKAAMFDCLESIWLAAKDDPVCDTYVIPIPYYDRNPDGSFGEMRYEIDIFPEYVPVTAFYTYDLELRKPDVIYIHNPYDEENYVTSVDPRFYSYELKKYTDMLVYVPYFVSGQTVAEHFCSVSAVKYANRVIVQSETVKKTYVKYAGERKVVVLGSPKIDAVVNAKREDFVLPDEWKRLIEKPDGSHKKIILYNTSVVSLLNGGEQYLLKLRSVFDTFKGRGDVILWWRPHPLSESTYSSMRPQLLKDYLSIVEECTLNGFCVYDETPDLHRAIALSDAYYGDTSSLVILYQCSGKLIMRQNINVVKSCGSQFNPPAEAYYDDGESIWFVTHGFRLLARLDKHSLMVEYINVFSKEQGNKRLFSDITEHNGKLVFIPLDAENTGVYNIKSKRFEQVSSQTSSAAKNHIMDNGKQSIGELVGHINGHRFFVKDIENLSLSRDCTFVEFSFADISGFTDYICNMDNAEHLTKLHDRQIELFKLSANADGSCGLKTHEYIKSEVK